MTKEQIKKIEEILQYEYCGHGDGADVLGGMDKDVYKFSGKMDEIYAFDMYHHVVQKYDDFYGLKPAAINMPELDKIHQICHEILGW